MHRFAPALLCALLLAGCGTSGATPTATPAPVHVATASYSDHQYGFSFKYPQNWSVPKSGGHQVDNGGVKQYVLDITVPKNQAGVSITVDNSVQPFPSFTNGHKGHIPNDPHTYVYFHRTVSQLPAMRVERYSGTQINEIDTFVNTPRQSYDIRTLSPNPPFTAQELAGYETIVKSFKPPFS
jgi:hypothetical protein